MRKRCDRETKRRLNPIGSGGSPGGGNRRQSAQLLRLWFNMQTDPLSLDTADNSGSIFSRVFSSLQRYIAASSYHLRPICGSATLSGEGRKQIFLTSHDEGEGAAGSEAVAEPAAGYLKQCVGDAEGKGDPSHHHERDAEFVADHRPGDGKNLPVHVGDHVSHDGQAEHDIAYVRRPPVFRPDFAGDSVPPSLIIER